MILSGEYYGKVVEKWMWILTFHFTFLNCQIFFMKIYYFYISKPNKIIQEQNRAFSFSSYVFPLKEREGGYINNEF